VTVLSTCNQHEVELCSRSIFWLTSDTRAARCRMDVAVAIGQDIDLLFPRPSHQTAPGMENSMPVVLCPRRKCDYLNGVFDKKSGCNCRSLKDIQYDLDADEASARSFTPFPSRHRIWISSGGLHLCSPPPG